MMSFLVRDVLDGILDLIESVSEGFPIYPSTGGLFCFNISMVLFYTPKDLQVSPYVVFIESSSLIHQRGLP